MSELLSFGQRADVHIGRKCVQRLIEVVHLHHYTARHHDQEGICAQMRELVVTAEGKLHGDAEAFDSHDRHGACHGTDGDVYNGIRASIPRCDQVDHHQAKHKNREAVHQEPCEMH